MTKTSLTKFSFGWLIFNQTYTTLFVIKKFHIQSKILFTIDREINHVLQIIVKHSIYSIYTFYIRRILNQTTLFYKRVESNLMSLYPFFSPLSIGNKWRHKWAWFQNLIHNIPTSSPHNSVRFFTRTTLDLSFKKTSRTLYIVQRVIFGKEH